MTLRIQRSAEQESVIYKLIGRIQTDHISQMEALLRSESPDVCIVLDLGDVRLVDRDAVQFLARQEAGGTRLRHCSAYIRQWISQERSQPLPHGTSNTGRPSGLGE
jgi:anti-anti-sigma regulatory factor